MGVWIETAILFERVGVSFVTPCMGVWIETLNGDGGALTS